jgi:hypothetical protein
MAMNDGLYGNLSGSGAGLAAEHTWASRNIQGVPRAPSHLGTANEPDRVVIPLAKSLDVVSI